MVDVSRVLLPTLLTAVLVAGGCGDADAPAAERPGTHRDHRAAKAPQTTEATEATPTEPAAAASADGDGSRVRQKDDGNKIAPSALPVARTDGAWSHLLDAGTLPAATEDAAWTISGTGPETAHPVGACQKTPLEDIGALHAVRRAYAGPEDAGLRARQVVARFADPRSAWRAHRVLQAWRDDCEERLDYPTKEVGPMRAVDLESGAGGHYRATYGVKKDTDASGLGIVRQGRWLSIVSLTATEGDYPAAWARRAVRRIAATF